MSAADEFVTTDGIRLGTGTVPIGGTWVSSGTADDFVFVEQRRAVEAVACPACGEPMVPVRVHGHEQCPHCRSVLRGCCEGDCP